MTNPIEQIEYLKQQAIEFGFSLPDNFTEAETVELLCAYNGIGAEWMPKWTRKILTKVLKHLEPVALVHDLEFSGTDKSYLAFTKANLRAVYNAGKSGYLLSGILFAMFCQLFGMSAWKDGKVNMCYYYYLTEDDDK